MEKKKCTRCKKEKFLSEFNKRASSKDGYDFRCRECAKKFKRIYYDKHSEVIKAYQKWYKKVYPKKVKTTAKKSNSKYAKQNGYKLRAGWLLRSAVRRDIIKRSPCVICGTNKDIHGHHDDYKKPLEVTWLCRSCHYLWHKLLAEWEKQARQLLLA